MWGIEQIPQYMGDVGVMSMRVAGKLSVGRLRAGNSGRVKRFYRPGIFQRLLAPRKHFNTAAIFSELDISYLSVRLFADSTSPYILVHRSTSAVHHSNGNGERNESVS